MQWGLSQISNNTSLFEIFVLKINVIYLLLLEFLAKQLGKEFSKKTIFTLYEI